MFPSDHPDAPVAEVTPHHPRLTGNHRHPRPRGSPHVSPPVLTLLPRPVCTPLTPESGWGSGWASAKEEWAARNLWVRLGSLRPTRFHPRPPSPPPLTPVLPPSPPVRLFLMTFSLIILTPLLFLIFLPPLGVKILKTIVISLLIIETSLKIHPQVPPLPPLSSFLPLSAPLLLLMSV